MMDDTDISELLQQRQARRRRLAQLSFEEKIEIVERLRELRLNRDVMSAHRVNAEDAIKDEGNRRDSIS
ncbi:MAG: hypothetical protein QOG71_3836 [Pyrinomonadaceae bacterium]|nr:hypothetical protein [Pyrinomonadaceae bacterium]